MCGFYVACAMATACRFACSLASMFGVSVASKYGFDASSNFETLIVAREPYVKNNFIYDFFYDFNMIKYMIWIFSIFLYEKI